MKNIFKLLFVLGSVNAVHAEDFKMIFPLLYEDQDGEGRLLSDLNKNLPSDTQFPSSIEGATSEELIANFTKYSNQFESLTKEQKADAADMVNYSWLSDYNHEFHVAGTNKSVRLCYKGDNPEAARKVPGFVAQLADNILSDGFGLVGWKYKQEKDEGDLDLEDAELVENLPKIWKDWRGRGEAVLILSANYYVDDFSYMADAIKKCK